MNYSERRRRLRKVLGGSECLTPASVHDPLSARVAEAVGYQTGLYAGSVASMVTLRAPDLILVTLTEVAEHVRRITRASSISLIVDADHGYGNALNVMRTVEELEHAGAAGLTIEDTVLPRRFGSPEKANELISLEEMVGKLRAAVAARRDPELVIVGRTSLKGDTTERIVERIKAYAATGIDMIFPLAPQTLEQLDAIHAAVKLPLFVAQVAAPGTRADLAARGVRLMCVHEQGYRPLDATVKALHECYVHLCDGDVPSDIKTQAPIPSRASLMEKDQYDKWQSEYLR